MVDPVVLICLALAPFAVAAIGVARVRARLSMAWQALSESAALGQLSAVALAPDVSQEEIRNALPAIAGASRAVVGILPLRSGEARSRIRVGGTVASLDTTTRSAAASLAALSLAASDVPECEEAVRSLQPQRGSDLIALLRQGESSLPALTRDRILRSLAPRPYWVVPVVGAGRAVALLIVVPRADAQSPLPPVMRAAQRLAWLFLPAAASAAREAARPATPRRYLAPAGAEVVLWLDPTGRVATYETLQETWVLPDSPPTLSDLLGSDSTAAHALMQRARHLGQTGAETTILRDGTVVHLSLLALSDVDDNVWGYAALLQRARGVTAQEPVPAQ